MTTAVAGYVTLHQSVNVNAIVAAILLICASLLWILTAPASFVGASTGKRYLRSPWLVLVSGAVLFVVGAYSFWPNAETVGLDLLWEAIHRGYEDHFEESDAVCLVIRLIAVGLVMFVSPVVLLVSTSFSDRLKIDGVGRYSLGFAWAIFPLVAGMFPIVDYTVKCMLLGPKM